MDRKSRNPEEISNALADLQNGIPIERITDKYAISKATLYRWRKKAQQDTSEEMARLKNVAEENANLRNLLADAALEIQALKEQINQLQK